MAWFGTRMPTALPREGRCSRVGCSVKPCCRWKLRCSGPPRMWRPGAFWELSTLRTMMTNRSCSLYPVLFPLLSSLVSAFMSVATVGTEPRYGTLAVLQNSEPAVRATVHSCNAASSRHTGGGVLSLTYPVMQKRVSALSGLLCDHNTCSSLSQSVRLCD